jgi:dinuclear metal center YbgI/SA1388 family protein
MRLGEIIQCLEQYAPPYLQDDYDNSGLQIGLVDAEITGVLICLDVTEAIIDEAAARSCNLIVSHHPLLFHPLKQISGRTYQQRCVAKALGSGISIYSAHTSLDNAPGGVNYEIARRIGLKDINWLSPKQGLDAGSGIVGHLRKPEEDKAFLARLKSEFEVRSLLHSQTDGRMIKKVAVCGGAGAFLLPDAIRNGADCFICGEFHYHDYFENEGVLLAELGHYQSEQFTKDLFNNILSKNFQNLRIEMTSIDTNPIRYDIDD